MSLGVTRRTGTGTVLGGGPRWRGDLTWRFSTAFGIALISVTVLTHLSLFFTISPVFCCCFKVMSLVTILS